MDENGSPESEMNNSKMNVDDELSKESQWQPKKIRKDVETCHQTHATCRVGNELMHHQRSASEREFKEIRGERMNKRYH